MPDFQVVVQRTDRTECKGSLTFRVDGSERFTTDCWEDPKRLIDAKDYVGCSTTIMHTKKHKAVYIKPQQSGDPKDIFIHPGSNPDDSDGCIVCAKARVEEIWETVPRDAQNITVIVADPG